MSRIDDLIVEHCPDGVEFFSIGDIAETVSGLSGKTKADFSDGNARFVTYKNAFANLAVDQNASDFVLVRPGEKQNSLLAGDVVITGSSESVYDVGMSSVVASMPIEPLYLNSFCFAVRLNDPKLLIPDFSKYLFRSESIRKQIRATANGVTRINISKSRFLKVRIPVPPLQVQREITQILDQFTLLELELEAKLEAEVTGRHQQLLHYRNRLLGRDSNGASSSQKHTALEQVVEFINGKPHERFVSPDGPVALLTARFISTGGASARMVDAEHAFTPALPEDIAMVMSDLPNGRALARSFYVETEGKYTANQRVCLLRVKDRSSISSRYLYHLLNRNPQLMAFDNGKDQTHLKKGQILAISVPVIPKHVQDETAAMLDRLDETYATLASELKIELRDRRKQYEHFLNRLLTFKESAS